MSLNRTETVTKTVVGRRAFLAGSAGLAALVALGNRGAAFAQEATPALSFPVTIPHAYGETVIESEPKRVVTWGWSSQDAVIALGVIPAAMPKYTWGGDADGVLPWVREALGAAALPILLPDASAEVPFEDIAAADPDLILAPYSGITQDDYDVLSKLAPTVAFPEKPWATSWQDQALIIGASLGRPDQGQKLVDDTKAFIAGKADEFPQIKGKTFAYGTVSAEGAFRLYVPGDPRVQLLEDLGMVPSDFVMALQPDDGLYFVDISPERIGMIDCDILVMWFDNQQMADSAEIVDTFSFVPAVQQGAYAPIVGESYVMASSAPTVLSIPWMLEDYVPQLAAAADKVS